MGDRTGGQEIMGFMVRAMKGYWGSGLCQKPLDEYGRAEFGNWVLNVGVQGKGAIQI